ncbi:group-specific protein [Paenibacillus odorifer]|uniref:group-specific protein n=1 Tax=Paenibacillus odorifer TaxID=189426 RepID=UPI00096BDDAB|nr:group-specific protein [Paenibacillus odorifer]OME55159.1 group-specific protein [Paenibacillus odorifer]
MDGLLNVTIDESEVRKIFRERVEEVVKQVDAEYVFWDTNELKKRTCMSWNLIQETFFFDERFQKVKIGSKWYYPVQETRMFLREWLNEQKNK